MNWGIRNNGVTQTLHRGAPVDGDAVMRGLQRFATADGVPFDLNQPYKGEPAGQAIASAWKRFKDPQALGVWQNAGQMGPVFTWLADANAGDGGDYLGRALSQNIDAAIWTQALVKHGVIAPPSNEWRQAIEVASLALDIGNDGAGRTGYAYLLTQINGYPKSDRTPVPMPAGLASRAGMLVGGSGSGGLHVEKVYDDANVAKQFAARLLTENPEVAALSAGAPPSHKANLDREQGMLRSGAHVGNAAQREAFADALLVVKLADRSRGRALRTALAQGSLDQALDAMKNDPDWNKVVATYSAKKAQRKEAAG